MTAMVVGLSLAIMCSMAAQAPAKNSTGSSVTVRTLAQGSLKALPAGPVFDIILEFRQVPGAALGPHTHVAAFVYTLHGLATISYPGVATQSVGPGQAAFIPALAVHTHDNVDGRLGAGAIAVGLIVVVVLLCAASWLRRGLRRAIIPVLSLVLIAGGALVLSGATSNDWYVFAVRPESQRTLPMPRPDGRVRFVSPDLGPVLAGPYVETLFAITVPPGARYDALDVPGPHTIVVIEGTAAVHVGDETMRLGGGGAAFAQAGNTLAIVNPGSDALQVLDFAVTPLSAVPPAA